MWLPTKSPKFGDLRQDFIYALVVHCIVLFFQHNLQAGLVNIFASLPKLQRGMPDGLVNCQSCHKQSCLVFNGCFYLHHSSSSSKEIWRFPELQRGGHPHKFYRPLFIHSFRPKRDLLFFPFFFVAEFCIQNFPFDILRFLRVTKLS